MDNDPPARAGRKKEEDGRRMRMKRGEGWVMPMMIGERSVLMLRMMVVVGNDAGMLMMMGEEIDVGLLMMTMEEEIDVWRMRKMSGDGMRC